MLTNIKRDIFDESIPIETTINKYFRLVQNWETTYNIAYKNTTCASVSNTVRGKLLKKKVPYEVGEVLICMGVLQDEKGRVPGELRVHH